MKTFLYYATDAAIILGLSCFGGLVFGALAMVPMVLR